MQGLLKKMPSSVDFHFSSEHFGKDLSAGRKEKFTHIKHSIDKFLSEPDNQSQVLKSILDMIEETKDIGVRESFPILRELTSYLRIEMLSNNPQRVYNIIILLDVVINNSGYRMHILISRRKFMKTFGLVLRRHLSRVSSIPHQRVSYLAIDRLQAWGEAFTSRRALYPHMYETYFKIIHKYHISFPRIYFDPARTPIRLGPITTAERQMVADFPDETVEHETKWEVEDAQYEPWNESQKISTVLPADFDTTRVSVFKLGKNSSNDSEEHKFLFLDYPSASARSQLQHNTDSILGTSNHSTLVSCPHPKELPPRVQTAYVDFSPQQQLNMQNPVHTRQFDSQQNSESSRGQEMNVFSPDGVSTQMSNNSFQINAQVSHSSTVASSELPEMNVLEQKLAQAHANRDDSPAFQPITTDSVSSSSINMSHSLSTQSRPATSVKSGGALSIPGSGDFFTIPLSTSQQELLTVLDPANALPSNSTPSTSVCEDNLVQGIKVSLDYHSSKYPAGIAGLEPTARHHMMDQSRATEIAEEQASYSNVITASSLAANDLVIKSKQSHQPTRVTSFTRTAIPRKVRMCTTPLFVNLPVDNSNQRRSRHYKNSYNYNTGAAIDCTPKPYTYATPKPDRDHEGSCESDHHGEESDHKHNVDSVRMSHRFTELQGIDSAPLSFNYVKPKHKSLRKMGGGAANTNIN